MEAYARPIRHLAEQVRVFAARPSVRLFHVWTDGALRESALEVVMGFEYHAENRSPFVRLDASHRKDGGCWDKRLAALRSTHDARRAAMEKLGYALPALGPSPTAGTSLARFGAGLAQVAAARCEPLSGLVLVLCPGIVEDARAFEHDLSQLVLAPNLRGVRWVVVEAAACSIGADLARAASAGYVRVEVDEQEALRDFEAKIERSAKASADAPGPAQTGAAWPSALPPGSERSAKRKDAAAEVAASLGLPPGIMSGALRDMKNQVLRGALALRRGDAAGAARHQSWAAQAALKAGLDREATLMEMLLANYLVHAQQRDLAEERYRACGERAKSKEWYDLAAQSYLAIGSLRLLARDRPGAARAYAAAGKVAKDGKQDSLAIEGYRMAGQCTAEEGDHAVAGQLFQEAMSIADPMPDDAAGRTSAPHAARALAKHYERSGLEGQAASLRAQADRMEQAAAGEETAA